MISCIEELKTSYSAMTTKNRNVQNDGTPAFSNIQMNNIVLYSSSSRCVINIKADVFTKPVFPARCCLNAVHLAQYEIARQFPDVALINCHIVDMVGVL